MAKKPKIPYKITPELLKDVEIFRDLNDRLHSGMGPFLRELEEDGYESRMSPTNQMVNKARRKRSKDNFLDQQAVRSVKDPELDRVQTAPVDRGGKTYDKRFIRPNLVDRASHAISLNKKYEDRDFPWLTGERMDRVLQFLKDQNMIEMPERLEGFVESRRKTESKFHIKNNDWQKTERYGLPLNEFLNPNNDLRPKDLPKTREPHDSNKRKRVIEEYKKEGLLTPKEADARKEAKKFIDKLPVPEGHKPLDSRKLFKKAVDIGLAAGLPTETLPSVETRKVPPVESVGWDVLHKAAWALKVIGKFSAYAKLLDLVDSSGAFAIRPLNSGPEGISENVWLQKLRDEIEQYPPEEQFDRWRERLGQKPSRDFRPQIPSVIREQITQAEREIADQEGVDTKLNPDSVDAIMNRVEEEEESPFSTDPLVDVAQEAFDEEKLDQELDDTIQNRYDDVLKNDMDRLKRHMDEGEARKAAEDTRDPDRFYLDVPDDILETDDPST